MSEASHNASEQSRPDGPSVGQHATGHPGTGERHRNEAVLGPFTIRDLTLLGGVLVTFVGSLLPLLQRNVLLNLWNAQNIFFLAIGFLLPAAAAGLFVWRRLEPRRSLRVGSLSVDQFASVVAVLSCSYYFVYTVTTFTPGAVVGLLGGTALVAATTAARVIPPFAGDFDGRAATPAHIVARDAIQPVHRPSGEGHGPDRVGAVSGSSREGRADSSPDGDRSAAWFGAGWAASAAGAGAAAGAGVAGAGAREPGAGASEASRVADSPPAEVAAERPEPTVAAPAGPAHAGVAPSADDVAGPDVAGAPLATEVAGAPAPAGAEESEEAEEPAVAPGPAAGPLDEVVGAQEQGTAEAAPSQQSASRPAAAPEPIDERGPEPAEPLEGAGYGDADGEAYGAPEPAAPATAVFPSALGAGAGAVSGSPAGAVGGPESIGASQPFDEPAQQYEAFWFAVSQPRTAVDPTTAEPLFVLEPGQWILALQDRGHEFVVQNTDGRVGVLRELSGIERG